MFILQVLGVLLLGSPSSRGFTSSKVEPVRDSITRVRLIPDERSSSSTPSPKQRVITPNDISTLFGNYSPAKKSVVNDDDIDLDFEDEEEFITDIEKKNQTPLIIAELEKLQTMTMNPPSDARKSSPSATSTAPSTRVKRVLAEPVAPDMEYLDLGAELDDKQQASLKRVMTVMDMDELSSRSDSPRVFQYDPNESNPLYDPMKFGAYARWKRAEEEVAKANLKKNPKKKNKEGLSPDSFYNAIKNLGSGPKAKDTPTGVGVTEPPPGKSPITPQKGLTKKNKRKVITPEEIDSLFSRKPSEASSIDTSGAISEKDDSDDNVFSPMLRDDEPVPQWIVDAEKAAKKQRQMKGKKQKKITDDWRFWGALIAVAGFGSAFFNVYKQTGGFGDMGGGEGFDSFGGPQELII